MALITCPECGKQISDKSSRCPSCGYPIATNEECENDLENMGENNETDNEEIEVVKYEEVELRESPVSIISLVCFIMAFVFGFISAPIALVLDVFAIVLAIVAAFEKNTKDTCGSVVIWFNIISPIILLVFAFFVR